MSSAERLLRFYPRAWRDRYGEEFVAMLGTGAIHPQQVLDILFGAVDAWLSSDVRKATVPIRGGTQTGGPMTLNRFLTCASSGWRVTARDGLIGAGAMIVASIAFAILGVAAARAGWTATSAFATQFGFLAALVVSMPFWLTKGQPWKAQALLVGGTLLFMILLDVFG